MLTLIYAAGVAQGVFLIVALSVVKVKRQRARWLLTAFICVLTTMIGLDAADWLIPGFNPPSLGLALEFALWPMLYLFATDINGPSKQPLANNHLHYIPVALAIVLVAYLLIAGAPSTGTLLAIWVSAKFFLYLAYAWLIWRELAQSAPASTAVRAAKRWIRRWFAVLIVLVFIVYVDAFLWMAQAPGLWGTQIPDSLTVTIALFSLGYFTLAHRGVLDRPSQSGRSASEHEVREIYQRVLAYLEDNETFRDTGLDLTSIANGISVPKDRVSHALNQIVDGGLVTILNERRFQAVRSALLTLSNKSRTVLDLAYEAGFNSKASFYRIFQAKEGVSPSAFRERNGDLHQSSA